MRDLALHLRPKRIEEFIGQKHLLEKGKPLYELLQKKRIPHSFFFGPPGCGKTTLACIIADTLNMEFFHLNATDLKIEQLRKIFKNPTKPLIFIDEVHRLSKNQQEVLLPPMEENTVLVIGASTENPFFALRGSIRSRSMLFELKPLARADMVELVEDVIESEGLDIERDAFTYLIESSNGDARAMLNLLEFAKEMDTHITMELLRSLRPSSLNDGTSEASTHYDLASAMIKSIRGSDPDAALYYLARLIKGAENPEFIARRLVILASEDIGNANPNALNLANSTMQSVAKIGYPEARIILSQCVIYLACSPKSNSAYTAINSAIKAVEGGEILDIPETIRQFNKNYRYPHDYGGYVPQRYLSKDMRFLEQKGIGYESKLNEWLEKIGR